MMPRSRKASLTVAQQRKYAVLNVDQAKSVATEWLRTLDLQKVIAFGLPEIDDRYHVWRVPLLSRSAGVERIGEVVIDAFTSLIDEPRSTAKGILEARLLQRSSHKAPERRRGTGARQELSRLRNTVVIADCHAAMDEMPVASVDLVFTSPPYFNARPEYSEYDQYDDYLHSMRLAIRKAGRLLNEGRFFVMNTSPVLLRRPSRSASSRRLAVPFDMHRLFVEEGFDFVDDIIWMKPEGAGWATGRGRRFAADRNPLQYKAVPVTEYVLVYRKRSERLIDWHIRNHPEPDAVARSKIPDGYERTNVWRIQPSTRSGHPAAFPLELAQRIVRYYSFEGDVVLDPFAGSGTTGVAAAMLKRRFVLCEINPGYADLIRKGLAAALGKWAEDILWVNATPASEQGELL